MFGQLGDLQRPITARTPTEFVEELNRLRRWAGEPSFRELSRLTDTAPRGARASRSPGSPPVEGQRTPAAASTIHSVLNGDRLPKLPRLTFVESFVASCLRSRNLDEELIEGIVEKWRVAWRAISDGVEPAEVENPLRGGEDIPAHGVVETPAPGAVESSAVDGDRELGWGPRLRASRFPKWMLPVAAFLIGALVSGLGVWYAKPTKAPADTVVVESAGLIFKFPAGTPDRTVEKENCSSSWEYRFKGSVGKFICSTIYVFHRSDGREEAFGIGLNQEVYHAWQRRLGDTVAGQWESLGGRARKGIYLREPHNRSTPTPVIMDDKGVEYCNRIAENGWVGWHEC